jgi:nitrogenase molybdenum-iron protein alpha chain
MAQDFDNLILEEIEDVVSKVGDFKILVNTFQAAEQGHLTRLLDPDLVPSLVPSREVPIRGTRA